VRHEGGQPGLVGAELPVLDRRHLVVEPAADARRPPPPAAQLGAHHVPEVLRVPPQRLRGADDAERLDREPRRAPHRRLDRRPHPDRQPSARLYVPPDATVRLATVRRSGDSLRNRNPTSRGGRPASSRVSRPSAS
jgi:hypothetical protein